MARFSKSDEASDNTYVTASDARGGKSTGRTPKIGEIVMYQSELPGDIQWTPAIVVNVGKDNVASLRLIGEATLHSTLEKDVPQFTTDQLNVVNPEGRGYKFQDAA